MKTLLALALGVSLAMSGCTSPQLAADEAAAAAGLRRIETAAADPATLEADIDAAVDAVIATDPSSAFLQKTGAAIKANATPARISLGGKIAGGAAEILSPTSPSPGGSK